MTLPDDVVGTALRTIVHKYGNPDPNTLAKLPKPVRKDAQKGRCTECGGWHGLPAVHLDYMGHAEVTLALIDVDPLWSWEPFAVDEMGAPLIIKEGGTLILWGRLTVHGKTLPGVGTCEAGKGDALKELIGDFLRNAAMRFGIGTKLWSKAEATHDAPSDPEPAPEPTYSKAAVQLFNACKGLTAEAKADLKAFAAENGKKVSADAFDNDPAWAEQVRAFIAREGK